MCWSNILIHFLTKILTDKINFWIQFESKMIKERYLYWSFLLNIQNIIHHKLCDLPASCIMIITVRDKTSESSSGLFGLSRLVGSLVINCNLFVKPQAPKANTEAPLRVKNTPNSFSAKNMNSVAVLPRVTKIPFHFLSKDNKSCSDWNISEN